MSNDVSNPKASVSPNNPSGSFKVTWIRGSNEVPDHGHYFIRISENQGLGGSMPFDQDDTNSNFVAEFTASLHGTQGHFQTFEISSSAQYQEGIKHLQWPAGVWPLSESRDYEVQINSDYEESGVLTKGRWIPRDTNTGPNFQTGSMGFTTSGSITSAPSAPTIAFSAKTTSAITVSWSAISGATNYRYYIGTSANPTSPGSNAGSGTSYQITSLSAGTTYYIRFVATNAGGNSAYSNELTIDTLTDTITNLTLSDNKPTRNDVAWTSPTGTAFAFLVAGTSTNPTSVVSTITGAGAKTFEHTGLDPGDEYFYRVRTKTTNHNNQFSAYSDNESQTNPSIDLPTSLGHTAEVHNINFNFTEPATWGERVYIFDNSGDALQKSGADYIVVDASGNSNWDTLDWRDDNNDELITGGNQSLTVKYKGYYDGEFSSFTSTVTGYSLPAPPTSFGATAVSDEQINLSWSNPTGSALSETFTIQRSTSSGGTYSSLTTTATGTSYSDGGLSASTTFYYKIRTNTSAGSSAYTSVVNAATQAGADVSAGDNLSLGALGKAVGANGGTTSETLLGADGRGSTGTQTRMQDFTTSAVSSMTVPDTTPDASTSAVATIAFANVGTLFLSRIANRAANFTWDETSNPSLFTLEETTSNYTASISYGSSAGSIAFTGKFNDSFNDHATNYNSAISETATIQAVTAWSGVPSNFSLEVDGIGDTSTSNQTITVSGGSGNTVVTCPTGLPPNRGGQLQVAASTSSTPSSGHAASVSISHTSSTLYMQFKLTGVSGGSSGSGSTTRAVTIVNNGVTATFNITVTQNAG